MYIHVHAVTLHDLPLHNVAAHVHVHVHKSLRPKFSFSPIDRVSCIDH